MTRLTKPSPVQDYPEMAELAIQRALADANLSYNDVQQVFCGYVYGDSTCGQRAVYQAGLTGIPIVNVNNNCSTGSSALFLARQSILAGEIDCVLAVGFEKMTPGSLTTYFNDRANPLQPHIEAMSASFDLPSGTPYAPYLFGGAAREHMHNFGTTKEQIAKIFENEAFSCFSEINVLPLIYDEKKQRCNILVFDAERARNETAYIRKETEGAGRKHPAYRFFDKNDSYICEVRYGNATANALQRGLWTNTKNATPFFDSVTNGWVDYSHNLVLVKLFSHALVSSAKGHETALEEIKSDIARLKQANGINA